MQLNPKKILEEKILEACEFTKCQQVGIDLTISQDLELENLQSLNILLNETVKLPSNVYSQFYHRSSFNRKGVLITGSIYDPGYFGRVGCTIYNMSGSKLVISKNERIGQMVFYKADSASNYNGQYQNEHLS